MPDHILPIQNVPENMCLPVSVFCSSNFHPSTIECLPAQN